MLPNAEEEVLEKAWDFAPAPQKELKLEIISSIEPILRDCKNQIAAEVARAKVARNFKTATISFA